MTSYRRTRSAIMDSARLCLQTKGYGATSMIDIADTAEISRATLYNHFRDKASVFRAYAEFEIESACAQAKAMGSLEASLQALGSFATASELMLSLRRNDPELLATIFSSQADPLWDVFDQNLRLIGGEKSHFLRTWLIGLSMATVDPANLRSQVDLLLRVLNTPR